MISISTIETSGEVSRIEIASRPVSGNQHMHASTFECARQGKYVSRIVVDNQHGAAGEHLVGAMQTLQHALFGRRKRTRRVMQEERGLVEKPLG